MVENANIDWVMHHELDWEYVTTMLEKNRRIFVAHTSTVHANEEGDELEIVCEGFYKIENTSIFAWFLIFSVGRYCWL